MGMWVQLPPGLLNIFGGVAERLIASVLKTEDGKTSVGSNPTTSSKCICSLIGRVRCYERRCDIGSNPIRCTKYNMEYKKIYYKIIENAKQETENGNRQLGYFETHHIIPKSLGRK